MPNKGTKAKSMTVSISGIRGKHPIRVGVAYWYRGHFLYGSHGNPVEPVAFATKEVHIIGTTVDTAPPYNPHGVDLENEWEIAALHKGMVHEWEKMMEKEEEATESPAEAFAKQTTLVEPLVSITSDAEYQDTQSVQLATAMPRGRPSAPTYNQPVYDPYYNDHALYLAASAPVSNRGTPSYSNTPYNSRPVSPRHKNHSDGAIAPKNRPAVSISRVDQLMIDHGVGRSIQTLQHVTTGLLNEIAVANFPSGQSVCADFSRTSTMSNDDDDDDNLTMGIPRVARASPHVPSVGFGFTPVRCRAISQPASRSHSRSHSRVPIVAGLNEVVGNSSRPWSRASRLNPDSNEYSTSNPLSQARKLSADANWSFWNASRSMSRVPMMTSGMSVQSHAGNEWTGVVETSRPTARMSSIPSNIQDRSKISRDNAEDTVRPTSRILSLPANMVKPLIHTTEDSSDPSCPGRFTQGHTGNRSEAPAPTFRYAPFMQSQPGLMLDTSVPSSRPMSRVPSTTNVDDVFGGFSRPLSRVQSKSSMSLLGDDFNGHHSKFFPTDGPALEDSPCNMLRYGVIGAGGLRKESMAKASVALNQAYVAAGCGNPIAFDMNTADRTSTALGSNTTVFPSSNFAPAFKPLTIGSDYAITNSSSFSDVEIGKDYLLKCPLHGTGCDGVTVTNLHMTEKARRTKGLVGPLPMVEAHGRQMVDWFTVLHEEMHKKRIVEVTVNN